MCFVRAHLLPILRPVGRGIPPARSDFGRRERHVHRKTRRWASPIAIIAILAMVVGATFASAAVLRSNAERATSSKKVKGCVTIEDACHPDHPREQELQEG